MEETDLQKLESFFSQYTHQSFKKGDSVIPGNTPQGVFYLQSGFIKQFNTDSDGNDILVNIFKPHTFFPMMWAVAGIPNHSYYECLTPCEVIRAPAPDVVKFISTQPEILMDLIKRIYVGMDGLLCRLEHAIQGNAYHKIICAILLLSKRFGVENKDKEIVISLPLSHQNLASIAGTSKETFTRTISKLKTKGIVDFSEQQLVVKDSQLLLDEIDS